MLCGGVLLQNVLYAQEHPPKPLTILELAAEKISAEVVSGEDKFLIKLGLKNLLTIPLKNVPLSLVFSHDENVSADDKILESWTITEIDPADKLSQSISTTLNEQSGRYYLFLCQFLDLSSDKVPPTQQCTEPVVIDVVRYEFEIEFMQVRPLLTVDNGKVGIGLKVQNKSDRTSAIEQLHIKLSPNRKLSSSDIDVSLVNIPQLEAGEVWQGAIEVRVTGSPGPYWLGACVSKYELSSGRDGKCLLAGQIEIVKNVFPDMVVGDIRARPLLWVFSEHADVYAEIYNLGESESAATKTKFYLSQDIEIDSEDAFLGAVDTQSLRPTMMLGVDLEIQVSAYAGVYWLGACVDPVDLEIDTFNNCEAGPAIEVVEYRH